ISESTRSPLRRRTMKRKEMRRVATLLAAVVLGFGSTRALAEDIPADAVKEADSIWQMRCTTCHGAQGKGDGAAAVALTPKPRDFTLATWQSSVTDAHIEKIIAEGGQGV